MLIAVLGTGSAGMRHLRVFSQMPGVSVVAIPSRVERTAELRGQGITAVGDITQAGPVDAAIVATDTRRHLADLERLWECGIRHILIEKPLAPTCEEAQRFMARHQSEAEGIFVGYCLRFEESLKTFRQRLPEIGPVYAVEIACRSFLPDWRPNRPYQNTYAARQEDGGVLRDLTHEVDYAVWLYGMPERVSGWLARIGRLEIESEDQADLQWEAPGGERISLHLDYLSRFPLRRMTAYGAQGMAIWDGIGRTTRIEIAGQEAVTYAAATDRETMYREQAKAFAAAVIGGSAGELVSFSEGMRVTVLCDAARRSSETRQWENI